MRFFYVTIFVLRVEGATAEECEVNKLCSSTKCKCEKDNDCDSAEKVCFKESTGGGAEKLILLTTANKLEPGKPATATNHFCVSAGVDKEVFKCVFSDTAADIQACNPHGATVDQANICPKSNTVLKAGEAGTGEKLCIGKDKSNKCGTDKICHPGAAGNGAICPESNKKLEVGCSSSYRKRLYRSQSTLKRDM